MPTDETRRVLKMFGVMVTALEDAVEKQASPGEVRKVQDEVQVHLGEVILLIERLKAKAQS